ncbi:MAG: hypothetical protein ACJAQT_000665 [Akkermansiaceae bacterium]|jgi:hypothetical protein
MKVRNLFCTAICVLASSCGSQSFSGRNGVPFWRDVADFRDGRTEADGIWLPHLADAAFLREVGFKLKNVRGTRVVLLPSGVAGRWDWAVLRNDVVAENTDKWMTIDGQSLTRCESGWKILAKGEAVENYITDKYR